MCINSAKPYLSFDNINFQPATAVKKRMSVDSKQTPITPCFSLLSSLELVKLCGESSEHPAWNEFHRRFDRYIKIYLRKAWKTRMMNGDMDNTGAYELIRDMAQDVYVNLLDDDQQAMRNFKGVNETSFLAYLSRIAVNVVAEHFRKQLAEKRKGQLISMEVLLDESACEKSGSRAISHNYLSHNVEQELYDQVAANELITLLDETLKGANLDRDKMIFQLYAIDGLTTHQIATTPGLGLKVSSVESIIRRVKDRLRQAMQTPVIAWQAVA